LSTYPAVGSSFSAVALVKRGSCNILKSSSYNEFS
jgi:hypothetical protein